MISTNHGFSATRRTILKGTAMVALIGLGNLPFDTMPALAAANDKWPEDAFKQKNLAVTAIVEAGGKLYSATKEVKVTVGGCGG
jgi:sulfur-oxidizing protein SoxY